MKPQPIFFAVVLLLLVGTTVAQTDCGPSVCYTSCTAPTPIVDLVFILDVSGSMATPLEDVVDGQTLSLSSLFGFGRSSLEKEGGPN